MASPESFYSEGESWGGELCPFLIHELPSVCLSVLQSELWGWGWVALEMVHQILSQQDCDFSLAQQNNHLDVFMGGTEECKMPKQKEIHFF